MADPNESSHFLLQPLNFNTATPPPSGIGKTGYHVDNSGASHDEANSTTTSGDHQHSWEPSTENPGLLIREVKHDGSDDLPKKQSRNVLLVWSLELALLLIATGFLGSIFAILGAYQGHELPDWKGVSGVGITLNALIAVIATLFRSILAFVALEVLAQLKWNWITKKFKPIGDMQRFDDASRGAWGSLMLLPIVFKRQPQAIIAVVVVVVSLAIGPFTQQTIQPYYCTRIAPGQPAEITVANKLDDDRLYFKKEGLYKYQFRVGLEAAIQDAVVNPSQSSNIADLFNCPSGNCTFEAYPDKPEQPAQERVSHASLGMCSRCEDISELVKSKTSDVGLFEARAILNLTVSSPNRDSNRLGITSDDDIEGAQYLDAKVAGSLSWAGEVVPKDFLNTARWSAVNWSMLAFSQQNCQNKTNEKISCPLLSGNSTHPYAWAKPTGYIAATCILYPCIKYYAGSVRAGALTESVIKSTPLRLQRPRPLLHALVGNYVATEPWQGVQSPCLVNNTLYLSTNMTSESKKLPESSRQDVLVHPENWERHSLDGPIGYNTVTAPQECIMTLSPYFMNAFQWSLSETFNSQCRIGGSEKEPTCSGASKANSLPMGSILRTRSTSIKTIRENMDSMAMRITAEMRRAGLGAYGTSRASAKGDSYENRSCLRVAWEWLVLPAVLLLMCMVSVGWLVMNDLLSKGNGVVWKSSVLPLLLKDDVSTLEKMSLKDMALASKKLEIRLEK